MSLCWEYINLAAMGLIQGTPWTLPVKTRKMQAPAFQSDSYSSETKSRHMASQLHLQDAIFIWETTNINPMIDTRDFVSLPLWPACQVFTAKLFLATAKRCNFLLAAETPWKTKLLPLYYHQQILGKAGRPAVVVTKAKVCSLRTREYSPLKICKATATLDLTGSSIS